MARLKRKYRPTTAQSRKVSCTQEELYRGQQIECDLRYFFRRRVPPFTRVLLVESGSRRLIEYMIPILYEAHGDQIDIDLVTCFAGVPAGLRGKVYRVSDYAGPEGRKRLYGDRGRAEHTILGIIDRKSTRLKSSQVSE